MNRMFQEKKSQCIQWVFIISLFFTVFVPPVVANETYQFVDEWRMQCPTTGLNLTASTLAVDSQDHIYTIGMGIWDNDTSISRVQKYDRNGSLLMSFDPTITGEDKSNFDMEGITVDNKGSIYLSDSHNGIIRKYSPTGTYVTKFGRGLLNSPVGMAVSRSEVLYVADRHTHSVQKFSLDGRFLGKIGSWGKKPGCFEQPTGVAVDKYGYVYVVDTEYWYDNIRNDRIQKFSPDGRFVTTWGGPGSDPGHFASPYGIAVDRYSNVFVTDSWSEFVYPNQYRVQKFSSDGVFLTTWGSEGTKPGEFDMPEGIAVDSQGFVYVGDLYNHRIQIFAPIPYPIPTIRVITPSSILVGEQALDLRVEGSQFVGSSEVLFNNKSRRTTYRSSTLLTVRVLPSDIIRPGRLSIKVRNPKPGGGISNTLSLKIHR